MEILRPYGAATTVFFPLIDAGAQDFEATPVTFAAGDVRLSKDGGAFANATNTPAHEGHGIYSLALTATEMEAATLVLALIDQTSPKAWEDQCLLVGTYGHTSARHETLPADVDKVGGETVTGPDDLKADVSGLSTFDPATDDVNVSDTDLADLKDSIKGTPDGKTVLEAYDKAEAARARVDALVGTPVVADTAVSGTEQDVAHYRGDTAPILFDLARDITGAALAFTVKRRHSDPQEAALIIKTSAESSEIEITDAEAGEFVVKLLAGDTSGLLPDGRRATFVYDVEMALDGVVETVAAGDFVLLPDVTTA